MNEEERDLGVQPLEGLMGELGLTNHDLVAASTEGLTHKQVARARKGRRLTPKMQAKVARALNAAVGEARYAVDDLFAY